MSTLGRWYCWLLRVYPASYRKARRCIRAGLLSGQVEADQARAVRMASLTAAMWRAPSERDTSLAVT